MKRFLQSYGIIVLSLVALFASGVFVGRMTAPVAHAGSPSTTESPSSPEAWVETASRGLIRDLKLDEAQQVLVRQQLGTAAGAIFSDQERALFQMHLRLLELHDVMAKSASLSESQLQRLAQSRSKLKELIIRKFPNRVRDNPSLVISEKN